MVLGAKHVNGVKVQTETQSSHHVDRRCRGDIVAGAQVSRRLRELVKLDQFAPRVALGEATAHGVTLSHGRSPKTGAVTANGRPPKNADCENYLGLSQSFSGGQIGLHISKPPAFFGKFRWLTLTKFLPAQFELRG